MQIAVCLLAHDQKCFDSEWLGCNVASLQVKHQVALIKTLERTMASRCVTRPHSNVCSKKGKILQCLQKRKGVHDLKIALYLSI